MYTKLDFCSELLPLIRNKASDSDISSWAARTDDSIYRSYDKEVEEYLYKLRFVDEPGFEIPRENVLRTCINMLIKYYVETYDSEK